MVARTAEHLVGTEIGSRAEAQVDLPVDLEVTPVGKVGQLTEAAPSSALTHEEMLSQGTSAGIDIVLWRKGLTSAA